MDSVPTPCLPLLLTLLLLSAGSVRSGPCFQHHCPAQDDVVSCVTDPQNTWLCKDHEVCEVKTHGPDLTMQCTSAQSCSQNQQDQPRCPEMPDPQDLHHACLHLHCCPDKECVHHHLLLSSRGTPPTRIRASSLHAHPRLPPPHQPHPEPLRQAHPEPRHHAHPEPRHQAHPEPRHQAHPEPRHQAHPEPRHQAHPEPRHQAHPEPRHQAHPEPRHQAHPEPRPQPQRELHLRSHLERRPEPHREPHQEPHEDGGLQARQADHHGACYSSHCGHGDNLHTCTSGTYLCHVDQYCDIHINHGNIDMGCHSFLDHKRQECEHQQQHNHPGCRQPYHHDSHDDCRYCCLYDSCVKGLMMSPTPVPTLHPLPTPGSCFTTRCDHKTQAAQCLSGQWSCLPDQYCHFAVHAHGEIKMDCHSKLELERCHADSTRHNRPICYDHTYLQAYNIDCHFCCQVADCVYTTLLGLPPSTTSTPTTTTTPTPTTTTTPTTSTPTSTPTTTAPTTVTATTATATTTSTTMPTTTTANPTTTMMTSKLTTTTMMVMSSTTANSAMKTTSVPSTCTDTYTGNCQTTFSSMCHVPEVRIVCRLTCNACHEATQCVDSHHGDCAQDFGLALCLTSPVVANVCRKTCGLCSGSGSSSNMSPAPPPSSAEAPAQCVQCGDFFGGVPCSSAELTQNSPSPCPDPAASLCMTDVSADGGGNVSVYKRCVDATTCQDLWYRRTFQDGVCMTFDPLALTPDLTCHYCCQGDGCNSKRVSDHGHLWRP